MQKIILTFLLLSLPFLLSAPVRGQALDSTFWIPDAPVTNIARSGNTIYLSGGFTYLGPNTGGGGVVNPADGRVVDGVGIRGNVRAAAPDGKGGWYIGGHFKQIHGWPQSSLAHILPDGSVDKDWNPRPNGPVEKLAVAGGTVYAAGWFTEADGQPRNRMAAFDAATGRVTGWAPNPNGLDIYCMAAGDNAVYVSGNFTSIGGQARNALAALDGVTGQATAWYPVAGVAMNALAVVGRTVYAGGSFLSIASGYERQKLVAFDAVTGGITPWKADADGDVTTLVAHGNTVYAGGSFRVVGREFRTSVAAIDAVTGQVSPWRPALGSSTVAVATLAVSGNMVYVGGNFESAGGQPRNNLFALDATTGQLTSWNPRVPVSRLYERGVCTISTSGGALFVGGDFISIGGQYRRFLAALDATTGQANAWNPDPDDQVAEVKVAGNTVYVSGWFKKISGQSRAYLAALDAVTGETTLWQPGIRGVPYVMDVASGTVYMAGNFDAVDGQSRSGLAAVDATTGKLKAWNPGAPGTLVKDLAVAGSAVYLGGSFSSVGGQNLSYLAAVDTTTGRVTTDRHQGADGPVYVLTAADGLVYTGGGFTSVGGQNRNFLAALDPATGRATDWNPQVESHISTVSVDNGLVYVAGGTHVVDRFNQKQHLVAIDGKTGLLTAWRPDYYLGEITVVAHKGAVHVGGSFEFIGNNNVRHLAVFGEKSPRHNFIRGNVYEDADGDCVKDAGERGAAGRVVVVQPGNYFGTTDSLGNYALAVAAGSYTVQHVIPASRLPFTRQLCPAGGAGYPVHFSGYNDTIAGKDFADQTQLHAALDLSVSSARRRRCFRSTTAVAYANTGTGQATGVKVYVKLPEYVVPVSADVPYQIDRDKNLVFDVGTLAPGARGTILLIDSVVCNNPTIRGLTQCTKAWITPENPRPAAPGWDGSDVTVKGACTGSGTVRLLLRNAGGAGMADSSSFRVYLDATLALSRKYKLAQGDSLVLQVPANGQTVRLEADQQPAHPRKGQSACTVEACGTDANGRVSTGLVNLFSPDDEEPEVSIQCLPIIDSFDPNDKAVAPEGITDQHYTPTRSRLDYVLRFQNTGNDVAYKVVVVDTLSADLDVSTLQLGAVSHPYKVQVSGKGRPVLTFTFNNIMLPDSNANEPKSHGYIQFSIKPRQDLPEKTRIENFADIFFDYNEPVRTNTTLNTMYDLPPVVAEAVKLDGSVVCDRARTPASAGTSRSLCAQDTVHLRAAPAEFGKGSWAKVSGGGTVRETDNPASAVTGLAHGDNVFEWRVAADACGTDSLRARVTITRRQQPAIPAITAAGTDSLACTTAARTYAWYLDGAPLGLSTRTIRTGREGNYTVRATDAEGCPSGLSAPFAYVLTAVQPSVASRVSLYPNPTTGRVAVVLPAGLGLQVHITVYDALGRLVASRRVLPAAGERQEEFDLSTCRPGVLLFKLQTPQGIITRRIVRSSR